MFPQPFRTRRKTEDLILSLAQEVALASRQAVRCRVEGYSTGISLNVLRGYVRARAAQPVQRRVAQRLHAASGLSPAHRRRVAREATERVVQLVVREMAGIEVAGTGSRRAA